MIEKKRTKAVIALLIIGIILLSGCINKSEVTKEQLIEKYNKLKAQYETEKLQGNNVTEVESLAEKAKQAYDRGEYDEVNKLLDKAFETLNNAKITTKTSVPSTTGSQQKNLISSNKSWLFQGIIYETHPYYYPNHSFKEITQQIPSLADLGIKTIYLMPIWEHEPLPSEENKFRYGFIYHIIDYYKISKEFGTEEELKEMIATAHKYDMKIIFDLVTCCTPEDSIIYNNGWTLSMPLSELQGKVSKLEYTKIRGNDYVYSNCTPPQQNVIVNCDIFGRIMNDKVIINFYPSPGFGYTTDKTNPELINYFTQVTKYYAKEFNIDGWRVDAPQNSWNADIISGDHSINKLLRSLEKELKMIKPDTILFLESSAIASTPNEDIPDPVLDETADISYSYYFYNKLKKLLAENANSEELDIAIINEKIWYDRIRSYFVENHDQPRINNRLPHLNRPLLVLITTISGVPMIQAGQEIGATNMFLSEAPVIWSEGDYELRAFYKKVFEIRNRNDALKYGSIKNIWKSGDKSFAYLKNYNDNNVVVVINFQSKTILNILNLPFESGVVLHDELNNESFVVNDPNNFELKLQPYGSRILVLNTGTQ